MTVLARSIQFDQASGLSHHLTTVQCDGPACRKEVTLDSRAPFVDDGWDDWTLILTGGDAENKDLCSVTCHIRFARAMVAAADKMEQRARSR